jgi:hypothetical protein
VSLPSLRAFGVATGCLLFLPAVLVAQRPCPPAPLLTAPADSGRIVLVARLTSAEFDRPRPFRAGDRPYISSDYSMLVYQPVAELRGRRGDANRDFYGELPELGGPDWTVGKLYLLVLQPMPGYGHSKRATYWTAACYGSQEVKSVKVARRLAAVPGSE